MLHACSVRIADFFVRQEIALKQQYEMLVYGIELILYTIISTFGLITIGVLLNETIQALIIIALYYTNQTVGGGKHAKSHLQCFLLMALFLCIGLLLCNLNIPIEVCMGIMFVSSAYMFFVPLILHPNKRYLVNKEKCFIARSRKYICGCVGVFFFCYCMFPSVLNAYSVGLMLSALSRFVAQREQKLRKNDLIDNGIRGA